MNRKALIIWNPGEVGEENYCAGVEKDVANYTSFLTSAQGGAWFQAEIEDLKRPSVSTLRRKLLTLDQFDYILIVFAGHGYYCTKRLSTILDLSDTEEIDSVELRKGSKKQTVILDCCRKKYAPQPSMMMDSARSLKKASAISKDECRKYFNIRIRNCPDGLVVAYGCDIDEVAGDDPRTGGYYSSSLLGASKNWADDLDIDTSTNVEYLSIAKAHSLSIPLVKGKSGDRQHPQIEKPRSEPYFPFAIVA